MDMEKDVILKDIHRDIGPRPGNQASINQTTKPMRQIVIETDGAAIHLVKADVSGPIELIAILENLIGYLNNKHNAKISSR